MIWLIEQEFVFPLVVAACHAFVAFDKSVESRGLGFSWGICRGNDLKYELL